MNRRSYITAISKFLLFNSLIRFKFGHSKSKNVTHSNIDPMTAISAANLTLNLIKGFSSKSDGMASLMQTQIQALFKIMDQLNEIQENINSIINLLNEIPAEIETRVKNLLNDAQLSILRGIIERYKSNILTVLQKNPENVNNIEIQNEIRDITYKIDDAMNNIRNNKNISIVEISIHLPIVLSIEVACRTQLVNFPKDAIAPILISKYYNFCNELLSDDKREGKIDKYIRELVAQHDEKIESTEINEIGKNLKIGNLKLKENQETGKDEYRLVGTVLNFKEPKITNTNDKRLIPWVKGIYIENYSIDHYKDKNFMSIFPKLFKLVLCCGSNREEISFLVKDLENDANWIYIGNRNITKDEMYKVYYSTNIYKNRKKEIERINILLSEISECRANIELAFNSKEIIKNTILTISEYLNKLK